MFEYKFRESKQENFEVAYSNSVIKRSCYKSSMREGRRKKKQRTMKENQIKR